MLITGHVGKPERVCCSLVLCYLRGTAGQLKAIRFLGHPTRGAFKSRAPGDDDPAGAALVLAGSGACSQRFPKGLFQQGEGQRVDEAVKRPCLHAPHAKVRAQFDSDHARHVTARAEFDEFSQFLPPLNNRAP